jgi:DUF4097 and DUF4098 domain-containing protein YvlB
MPTFTTPAPISVAVELGVGDIQISAGERTETTVEVRPSDASKKSDVAAAEQTRVEYANGLLLVKAPKGWRQYTFRGGNESISVQIDLPAGSRVTADAGVVTLRSSGRLGDCTFKTGVGDIQVEETGALELKTGAGDIGLGRATGHVEITTGSGALRIGSIDGSAVIKNSNGDTSIGEVTGDLRVSAANGKISVGHAHSTVTAKTANGDVRLGEVERGAVVADTGSGNLEVGIRNRVAAWLDLNTGFGEVHNSLDHAGAPEPGEDTVEVRARTAYGNITVRRALGA